MKGSVIQTLMKVFLTLFSPVNLAIPPLIKLSLIAIFEPLIQYGYRLNRILWQHHYHLLPHLPVHLLNRPAPDPIKLIDIQLVPAPLALPHRLNLALLPLEHIHRPLEVPQLVVLLVHLVLDPKEHVLVLILRLELEVLGSLRERGVVFVEDGLVEGGEGAVGGAPEAERAREVLGHLEVGVGDLAEVVGLELGEGLAEVVVVAAGEVTREDHGF
jgi:hypothetical protein